MTYERTITTRPPRVLSTFAGAVQIRKEIALALFDDVAEFCRATLRAGAADPAKYGGLALDLTTLLLNKTIGNPKDPYDELTAPAPGIQTDKLIISEAHKILSAQASAPLDKYLEIADRGIVKRPAPPDDPEPGPNH